MISSYQYHQQSTIILLRNVLLRQQAIKIKRTLLLYIFIIIYIITVSILTILTILTIFITK
jgi:hypothetical protein